MSAAVPTGPFRIVHTVCSHDCPDSCAVLVTVNEEGRAVKVAGDPSQPVTQGFLCGKVAKYLDRVYAPERILYPLKRKAGIAKGPLVRGYEHEAFERVSWNEALGDIAARLQETSDRYGPESILPYSYAGTIGVLGFGSMDRRFFHRLGASQLDRTICSEAGGVAWNLVYGKKLSTPTEDFKLAKLIVAWGANIHGNNVRGAGAAQRRTADRDRSLPHAHCGPSRLAHCYSTRHGRRAGPGPDACDPERRP